MNGLENKVESQLKPNRFSKVWIVLLLGLLTAFGPLSMDMYLPALPIVTVDLHTTASLAQLSLTACLLGLATGQLIFGPLSDIQGRRRPLVSTLIIYSVASLLCVFAPNIWVFIGLRFIQGVSGAAGIVIARASARDMYTGKDLTKFIALLSLVNGAAPILAPIFGGAVLNWVSWPAVFVILSVIGLIMLLSVIVSLPETLPIEKRSEASIVAVLKTFRVLLKDHVFMGIALAQSFISMSMFAYIAGSPFVLQNIYGVTPQQFSLIFAANGVGIIIAAQLTSRLANKMDELTLLLIGIMISVIGSILLLIAVLFTLPLWALIPALFLVVSSMGMVGTASFSLGMERQGKSAGSASAFLGILPFGGGALVSPLVGLGGEYNALPMGIVIIICSMMSLVVYFSLVKYKI
ncbi:multidrug effflux MFS transporter [Oceanobacillus chungangensis]|uniref:Bcr/CflA family efflux transporter n=1 Tax=Oceanobacillus chungangensis TaxID=1229152 RepID=A0A3D8PRU6_9BACI|nr:multidrug effflux MFS transporter [Oceanobacillus chungangensis]RDW18011.1 MFS transporter [Oceanobacillus chungangensis]